MKIAGAAAPAWRRSDDGRGRRYERARPFARDPAAPASPASGETPRARSETRRPSPELPRRRAGRAKTAARRCLPFWLRSSPLPRRWRRARASGTSRRAAGWPFSVNPALRAAPATVHARARVMYSYVARHVPLDERAVDPATAVQLGGERHASTTSVRA